MDIKYQKRHKQTISEVPILKDFACGIVLNKF
jgi:hypothetical protein